jgi:glucokinase
MRAFVGCDLGGTNIKAGVVDVDTGHVISVDSAPTLSHEGPEAVMARMADLMEAVIARSGVPRSQIGGVGASAPGKLDLDRGLVLFLTNLPGHWPDVPLRDTLRARLRLPVSLLNDVRAITYGEWMFGAGRGVSTMACFAIGTGVGGGVVVNGQLHLGLMGTAGELGHIVIDINGERCGCGGRGCAETIASGPAIAAMGAKAVMQGYTTSIGERVGYDLNRITPRVIAEAARAGDPIACEIYEKAGEALGIAAVNVIMAVAPSRIVIGGGVGQAGDLLIEPIRRTIRERVFLVPSELIEIVPAALGVDAGIVGMAAWAARQG